MPEQRFVLDHIAKPAIRDQQLEPWKTQIERLAQSQNVFCKLSGMVTEAVHGKWQAHEFHRYLEVVIAAFGTDRVMIGSDWPVCLLAGSYERMFGLVEAYTRQLSHPAREKFFGGNASRFYRIRDSQFII